MDERRQARLALLVIGTGVVCAMHVGKLPAAIPALREELGLSLVEAGFMLAMVQVAGMVGGLLIGLLADRQGPLRVMLSGLMVLVLSSAVGAFAQSVEQLMVIRAVEGTGFLLAVLPAPGLMRRLVHNPATLSRALGGWGAYMPIGTAVALLIGVWVIAWVGWRGLWLSLAAMSAACAGLLWRLVQINVPSVAGIGFLPRLRQTLRNRGPWLMAFAFFFYSGQWLAVVGFLPTIYAEAGISVTAVGWLSALAAGINMLGNIAAGRLMAIAWPPGRLLSIGYVAMGAGAAMAFAMTGSPVIQYGGVLLFSALGGLIPGTLFSMSVSLAPTPDTVSTTVGWMQQWSSLGQFFGPPMVAALAAMSGGWHSTWWMTTGCSLLGMLLAWLLQRQWEARPRPKVATA